MQNFWSTTPLKGSFDSQVENHCFRWWSIHLYACLSVFITFEKIRFQVSWLALNNYVAKNDFELLIFPASASWVLGYKLGCYCAAEDSCMLYPLSFIYSLNITNSWSKLEPRVASLEKFWSLCSPQEEVYFG